MDLVNGLKWRYATKKFDTSKKVDSSDLETMKEAVRLSASSYGLQAYKVLVVQDEKVRKQLRAAAWDQPQITDSSLLFVFCHYQHVDEKVVDDYMNLVAETKGVTQEMLTGFRDMINGSVAQKTEEQIQGWTARQTYIALSNLLAAAAEMQIDTCPMEGFDGKQFDEILGLKEKGLSVAVIAAVGYRSADDETQHTTKVRKAKEELFETI